VVEPRTEILDVGRSQESRGRIPSGSQTVSDFPTCHLHSWLCDSAWKYTFILGMVLLHGKMLNKDWTLVC